MEQAIRVAVDERFEPSFRHKLDALPAHQNEYGYDAFGFHRDDAKIAAFIARFFHDSYFRVESHGAQGVPEGRVLIVANHSGQLPFDAIGIGGALLFDRDPPRIPRAMIEKFIPTLPFVSYLFSRWGQIIGTPENCIRLLEDDEAILVFPEGARGISKPFNWVRVLRHEVVHLYNLDQTKFQIPHWFTEGLAVTLEGKSTPPSWNCPISAW